MSKGCHADEKQGCGKKRVEIEETYLKVAILCATLGAMGRWEEVVDGVYASDMAGCPHCVLPTPRYVPSVSLGK
jgi:hypothetical protein